LNDSIVVKLAENETIETGRVDSGKLEKLESSLKQPLKTACGEGETQKGFQKSWKPHSSRRKMVLGDDVGLGEISVLLVCR